MGYKGALVWLRRDLRILDNPALYHAAEQSNAVLAVYFLPREQWQRHGMAKVQQALILRQLGQLEKELADYNIQLLVLDAGDFKGQITALSKLCAELRVDALFANKELEVNEQLRDGEVQKQLNIPTHWFDEACYFPPGTLLNGKGEPYKVFTPFSKGWKEHLFEQGPSCLGKPKVVQAWPQSKLPSSVDLKVEAAPGISQSYEVGTERLLYLLRSFAADKLSGYKNNRDFPAIDGTSQLSPYLATGAISIRQCVARLWAECEQQGFHEGAMTWLNELIWRDFYKHVMVAWPQVQKGRCFNPDYEKLNWQNREDWFLAWCEGNTGYPIIDAAMRQLNQTGWMHNRLRMIVASFLTKDLLIDWRWGERYFISKLIDGDLAANNGGWQWAASTGTDAAPYFRIFNPTTQSQRFDPKGDFIRNYIPELALVNAKQIHLPGDGKRYNKAIVDHKVQRQQALDLYQQARRESGN